VVTIGTTGYNIQDIFILSTECISVKCGSRNRLLPKNVKIKIYRTIILPVVLYGSEACSLTLREERRLMVFENRVLRRVFGPKKGRGNRGMEEIT
jgi:hypothetical protein